MIRGGLGKCCPCLDEALGAARGGEIEVDLLADAVVLAPWLLSTSAGIAAVPLPMCVKHRAAQLSTDGKGRLIVS